MRHIASGIILLMAVVKINQSINDYLDSGWMVVALLVAPVVEESLKKLVSKRAILVFAILESILYYRHVGLWRIVTIIFHVSAGNKRVNLLLSITLHMLFNYVVKVLNVDVAWLIAITVLTSLYSIIKSYQERS